MDPFALFQTEPYSFLTLKDGTGGKEIDSEYQTTGIIKLRNGKVQVAGRQSYTSESTLHIRSNEPFIATLGGPEGLVGHGIMIDTETYSIIGVTTARDFDTGLTTFHRATLERLTLSQSSLPLE
jgi:hypothetical protein